MGSHGANVSSPLSKDRHWKPISQGPPSIRGGKPTASETRLGASVRLARDQVPTLHSKSPDFHSRSDRAGMMIGYRENTPGSGANANMPQAPRLSRTP